MSNVAKPAKRPFLSLIGAVAVHPAMLAGLTAGGLVFLRMAENTALTVPFSAAVVAITAALFFALSRRLAFSLYSAWFLVGVLTVVSAVKYRMKGFSFHFYDAVMVANDTDVHHFLFTAYLELVLPVLLLLGLALAAACWLFRVDRRRSASLAARSAVLGIAAAALPVTYPAEASEGQRYFYYLQGRHASAFFVSLLDLSYAFGPSDLEERLARQKAEPPFPDIVECGAGPKPDVFVVLEESQTDPTYFPQIARGEELKRAMEGASGAMRPLNVEVFGGGTWISTFSLMTGLSATDFGWRSPYLTMTMEKRIDGALPEVMKRCGYRTAAILPFGYTFVNEGPFLRSIGFDTVLDMAAIGAPTYHLRDEFYFDAAEKLIADHRRTDGRPLFLFMETMFPHSPYGERLEAGLVLPGEPFDGNGEAAEYLRRMVLARQDFGAFWRRREAEQKARPSVVMSFGDHQSFATSPYVHATDGADALARPGSLAYRTFFTLSGGERVPEGGRLDIPFLALKVLDASGIPGSPLFADLRTVEERCEGVFYACAERAIVDRHLKRRVSGGQLRLDGVDAGS